MTSRALKRIYLKIIEYAREVLEEDWSELPLPDFAGISANYPKAVEGFAPWLIILALTNRDLAIQYEGMLATLDPRSREQIRDKMRLFVRPLKMAVPTTRSINREKCCATQKASESPSPPPTSTPAIDYEMEYKSLLVLYEAIASEADDLREQLVLFTFSADCQPTLFAVG